MSPSRAGLGLGKGAKVLHFFKTAFKMPDPWSHWYLSWTLMTAIMDPQRFHPCSKVWEGPLPDFPHTPTPMGVSHHASVQSQPEMSGQSSWLYNMELKLIKLLFFI